MNYSIKVGNKNLKAIDRIETLQDISEKFPNLAMDMQARGILATGLFAPISGRGRYLYSCLQFATGWVIASRCVNA